MANMVLGFIMDILVFWGTAMGAAMTATAATNNGVMVMPPLAVALFALTVAVVQAGRRWDSKRSPKTDAVVLPPDVVRQVVVREMRKPRPEPTPEPTPERTAEVTPKRVDVKPRGD